jgi:hypothetical protein
LNASRDDGERWVVSGDDARGWRVIRMAVPGLRSPGEVQATSEAAERPAQPADPRPSSARAVPPYGAGA